MTWNVAGQAEQGFVELSIVPIHRRAMTQSTLEACQQVFFVLQARLKAGLCASIDEGNSNSPAAVPEVEGQIAKELDRTEVDINRSSQASSILRNVVREDDAPHGALA